MTTYNGIVPDGFLSRFKTPCVSTVESDNPSYQEKKLFMNSVSTTITTVMRWPGKPRKRVLVCRHTGKKFTVMKGKKFSIPEGDYDWLEEQ